MQKRARDKRSEKTWRGLGVSEGVAVGRVLRIHTGTRQIFRATLDETDIEREIRRLRAAIRLARRQLKAIKTRAEKKLGADHSYIFDAHLLILEDQKLQDETENYIRHEHSNAEWAVKVAVDGLLALYSEIKDDYLRARGSDIEDVAQRLLDALSGEPSGHRILTEDAVIVAEDLLPSAMAELDFDYTRAIATDVGGWTSHTAIIARGLNVPAIVGLRDLYRHARTGDRIIIDATRGEVTLHPSDAAFEKCKQLAARTERRESASTKAESTQPLRTLDGVEMFLRANLELPAEYEGVERFGAHGVGLYRSEFLLSHRGEMPLEDEQCAAYVDVLRIAGEDGATIRFFDLGGDKIGGSHETERNPVLGLRAIRYSLRNEGILRTQARAALRAAAHGRLRIVLPMITDISDVRRARRIIDEERARLDSEKIKIGMIEIGAMIEVPAAVFVAEKLAREVDFFSLGTNDLVQYTLAVDRGNDAAAEWFRSLHPAVLQSIRLTLEAAKSASIPVNVCGEMAGTPAYSVVLAGLGAIDFSMTASSIPRVRRTLAAINLADAQVIAAECLRCETADDAEELVRKQFAARWPPLFSPENLPSSRN